MKHDEGLNDKSFSSQRIIKKRSKISSQIKENPYSINREKYEVNNEKNIRFAFNQSKSLENLAFYHPLSNEIDNIVNKNSYRRDKKDSVYQFSKKELESTFFNKFFKPQNYFYSNSPFSLKLKEKLYENNNKHISSENFKNILKHIMNLKQSHKLNIKCLKQNKEMDNLIIPKIDLKSPFITNQESSQSDENKLTLLNNIKGIKDSSSELPKNKSKKNHFLSPSLKEPSKIKTPLKSSNSLPHKLIIKRSYKDVIQLNEEKKAICFKPSLVKKIEPSQIIFEDFEKKFPNKLSKVNSFHRMVHHHQAYIDHNNQLPLLPLINIKTLI